MRCLVDFTTFFCCALSCVTLASLLSFPFHCLCASFCCSLSCCSMVYSSSHVCSHRATSRPPRVACFCRIRISCGRAYCRRRLQLVAARSSHCRPVFSFLYDSSIVLVRLCLFSCVLRSVFSFHHLLASYLHNSQRSSNCCPS